MYTALGTRVVKLIPLSIESIGGVAIGSTTEEQLLLRNAQSGKYRFTATASTDNVSPGRGEISIIAGPRYNTDIHLIANPITVYGLQTLQVGETKDIIIDFVIPPELKAVGVRLAGAQSTKMTGSDYKLFYYN